MPNDHGDRFGEELDLLGTDNHGDRFGEELDPLWRLDDRFGEELPPEVRGAPMFGKIYNSLAAAAMQLHGRLDGKQRRAIYHLAYAAHHNIQLPSHIWENMKRDAGLPSARRRR